MMYVGNVAILENQYIDQQKGIEQDVAGCDCERMVEGGAMLTGQLLPRKPCDHQEENKQEPDVPATIKIDRPGTSHGQQRVDQIKKSISFRSLSIKNSFNVPFTVIA